MAGVPPPSLPCRVRHTENLLVYAGHIDKTTQNPYTTVHLYHILFSLSIHMGMRKKMRNKMKQEWKEQKLTRDKKKLKRIRKAAATAVKK